MRIVDGLKRFWSKKQQKWIDCGSPSEMPCPKCGQRHWYHEDEAFGYGIRLLTDCAGGLKEVDKGGCQLREAMQAYLDAPTAELGPSWLLAPVRFWTCRSWKRWQGRMRKATSRSCARGYIQDSWSQGVWQVVKRLAKRRVGGGPTLVRWAPLESFSLLVVQNDDVEKAEVVVFACLSVACLLRVGEAATVQTSESRAYVTSS